MNKFQHVGTLKYNKVFNTRGHTYLTGRLYYQRIIHKYKCLSSLFFSFFLLEIERERERVLRKGVGRNSLNVYLAFFGGLLLRVFSLLRASGIFFYSFGLKASVLLVQDSFRFFTRSLAWDSPMRSWPPPSTKNWYSLALFPLTKKGATSALGF